MTLAAYGLSISLIGNTFVRCQHQLRQNLSTRLQGWSSCTPVKVRITIASQLWHKSSFPAQGQVTSTSQATTRRWQWQADMATMASLLLRNRWGGGSSSSLSPKILMLWWWGTLLCYATQIELCSGFNKHDIHLTWSADWSYLELF